MNLQKNGSFLFAFVFPCVTMGQGQNYGNVQIKKRNPHPVRDEIGIAYFSKRDGFSPDQRYSHNRYGFQSVIERQWPSSPVLGSQTILQSNPWKIRKKRCATPFTRKGSPKWRPFQPIDISTNAALLGMRTWPARSASFRYCQTVFEG